MLKQALAVFLSLLLAVPLWAGPAPVGTIALSNGVTISGTLAAPGSSLYSGDTLTVQQTGNASLLLDGGSRVLLSSSTVAQIIREGQAFELALTAGGVAFTSSAKSLVEGRVADVTFRPEDPTASSVGYISFVDAKHPVFYANKGIWLLTTTRNGRTVTLKPGEKIEGVVATDAPSQNNQNNQETTPNPNNKKRKWAVFWIGGIAAGTATGLGLAFGQSECTAPFQGPGCSVSNPRI